MIFNSIFRDCKNLEWNKYWSELGVNYSKINENRGFDEIVIGKLRSLKHDDIRIMSKILEIKNEDIESVINEIVNNPQSTYLIYLDVFIKRKKKAIDELYNYIFGETDSFYREASSLVASSLCSQNPRG